ncbi:hypothetical protein JCM8202v2_002563 [Rhodotorula sphaerocarpa]
METAALDALDVADSDLPDSLSQSQSQSQPWTQTQTQTQQTQQSQGANGEAESRFPGHLWGILVAVTGSRTASAHVDAGRLAAGANGASGAAVGARGGLARPERLELVRGRTEYTVGRHPKSDLCLNGPKISSGHARIWIEPEKGIVRLEDKGTNGTYVRNCKVGKGRVTVLESGDPIVFGPASTDFDQEFRYIFQCDPSLALSSRASDPYNLGELSDSQSADGTSIHSFYEVREQIGKGSFATVRKGVRRRDGMMVAIKIIQRARFANNPKTVEMIEREVRIIQTLEHCFCVRCYDYFEDEQRIWLVLEYVDGGDLLDYVMKRRGLKESEVREIALMICEAVAYLHSRGITHRDLKPENLLLTRGEHPVCKVTDFGLAKMADDQVLLHPNPQVGYSSIVDAWSIGIVLWCCLTNQTPFDESETEPLAQRMQTRHVDMSLPRRMGVSEVALDFLYKLLTVDPRRRMSCSQALKHPWLRTKGSSSSDDADSVASAPFVCSSLPYNDPARSRIGSSAGEDAAMTAVSGTSPAQSHARVDGLQAAQQESGIDSQGFAGKLVLSNGGSPAEPQVQANNASSPLAGQKRKEPMSAFSDSSLSSVPSAASVVASPGKMSPPPAPVRKEAVDPPVGADAQAEVLVAASDEEAEPRPVEEDNIAETSRRDRGDAPAVGFDEHEIGLTEKPTGTPPSTSEVDLGHIDEEEADIDVTPPKKRSSPRRPQRGSAQPPSTGRGANSKAHARRQTPSSVSPSRPGPASAERGAREPDSATAAGGIAATVKGRRRKVARYT